MSKQISPEDARLTEAEKAFRNLGAEMRAFANRDRLRLSNCAQQLKYPVICLRLRGQRMGVIPDELR